MNVSLLALDEVLDTGLATLLDTFAFANSLAPTLGDGAPRFEVAVVGLRRRVRTHHGARVDALPLDGRASEVLALPALFATSPDEVDALLDRPDVADAAAALADQGPTTLAAACTSTFLLARSGVLDGHRATTSWWLAPAFRARFPAVTLDASRMVVEAAGRITAGAAMAHVDLALWIVRQASPALASLVARYLVVEPRPSQAPFIIPDHLATADPVVERFERWVREHLQSGLSLEAAARAVGASQRSLERRVRAVVGKTPVAFLQDIRVEVAAHLLRTTTLDLETVAAQVGYADASTLRTLLRRKLGRGVRELRARAEDPRLEEPDGPLQGEA